MTFFVRKIPFTCQNFFAENTKTQKHKKNKKPSVALALRNVFRNASATAILFSNIYEI